jgi:diguanylate cyclase (GGDEF)-like protein
VLSGVAVVAAVCLLLVAILSRVTRPIRDMTSAMRRLSDGEVAIEIPATGRRDEVGKMAQALAVFKSFAHRSTHDALTDLPNRALLHERMEKALTDGGAGFHGFALHILDLDRFKEINDGLGHAAGDEVLRVFSARLLACVRKDDTVARLGGDEFCILQWTTDPNVEATALAKRILAAMQAPIEFEAHVMSLGTSIGIAIAHEHGEQPDALMKNADLALYAAKSAGRGTYRFFTKNLRSTACSSNQFVDAPNLVDDAVASEAPIVA